MEKFNERHFHQPAPSDLLFPINERAALRWQLFLTIIMETLIYNESYLKVIGRKHFLREAFVLNKEMQIS
jgi:hypothetical protein